MDHILHTLADSATRSVAHRSVGALMHSHGLIATLSIGAVIILTIWAAIRLRPRSRRR